VFPLLCNKPSLSLSRNGALRDAQPARILENTARTKVARYRAGYAELRHAFLPCVISTAATGGSTASS